MVKRYLINELDGFNFLFVAGFLLALLAFIYLVDFLYRVIIKLKKSRSKIGFTAEDIHEIEDEVKD